MTSLRAWKRAPDPVLRTDAPARDVRMAIRNKCCLNLMAWEPYREPYYGGGIEGRAAALLLGVSLLLQARIDERQIEHTDAPQIRIFGGSPQCKTGDPHTAGMGLKADRRHRRSAPTGPPLRFAPTGPLRRRELREVPANKRPRTLGGY